MSCNRYYRFGIDGNKYWMSQCGVAHLYTPARSVSSGTEQGVTTSKNYQTSENRMSRYRYHKHSMFSSVFNITTLPCENVHNVQRLYRSIDNCDRMGYCLRESKERIRCHQTNKVYRRMKEVNYKNE